MQGVPFLYVPQPCHFFATQFCNIFKKFLYSLFVLKQNFEINLMQANFAFARQHGRPTTKTGVSWKKLEKWNIWSRRIISKNGLPDTMNILLDRRYDKGSLEWPVSDLFLSDVSVWHQYKYISFNIFSYRILIISRKMVIITGISHEDTNALSIYAILCWNVTIFYRQELASIFQVQEILKACRKSRKNFSSSCFIADDTHIKVIWLHVEVFREYIFRFCDNVHLWNIVQ